MNRKPPVCCRFLWVHFSCKSSGLLPKSSRWSLQCTSACYVYSAPLNVTFTVHLCPLHLQCTCLLHLQCTCLLIYSVPCLLHLVSCMLHLQCTSSCYTYSAPLPLTLIVHVCMLKSGVFSTKVVYMPSIFKTRFHTLLSCNYGHINCVLLQLAAKNRQSLIIIIHLALVDAIPGQVMLLSLSSMCMVVWPVHGHVTSGVVIWPVHGHVTRERALQH